jgi:hypothetical protein
MLAGSPSWNFEERLPTPEMVGAALPEGVLNPGGYISGWLYFEKVDDDESRVQLRASMRNIEEEPIARLTVPFATK